MDLLRETVLVAIGLAATLDRSVERVERERQALHRRVKRAWLRSRVHARLRHRFATRLENY
jgi:hypothetical protein